MSDIKVFGHLNPDTDTVCSAIVYAWYLRNHKKMNTVAYVLGSLNKETQHVLDTFGHATPSLLKNLTQDDVVIIVDTNNPEELLPDFKHANLQEIVDHHKLTGGIATSTPVTMTLRPVACTATIIWQLMQQEAHIELPADIAGLMLASILSDTLNFTSPTVTEADKDAAQALALIAKVDPDKLADGMFEAKSDLSGLTARDILRMDSKDALLGGKKIRIASIETTKPGNLMSMEEELLAGMAALKQEDQLDGFFFFVVDILTSSAQLLAADSFERLVAERGFKNSQFDQNIMQLPGIVSRKKQMMPALENGIIGS